MDEVSLRYLVEIIIRRHLVIAFTVVAVLLASLYSLFMTSPVYEGRPVLTARG